MAQTKMNVKVVEHNGEEHITEVTGYDAKVTHAEIKSAQSIETSDCTVVIGNIIIDARNVKSVTIVEA